MPIDIEIGNIDYKHAELRTKAKIISKIETHLEQMSESVQKKNGGIKSKRRDELLKKQYFYSIQIMNLRYYDAHISLLDKITRPVCMNIRSEQRHQKSE